ncbi:MAG: N-acetylmuramoyl-L-alanine amidase, partial [Planctomycetes bacterium]|nr:N-acetylmuramoyl-L-alanine amidase [Planctomycetota bacterium]
GANATDLNHRASLAMAECYRSIGNLNSAEQHFQDASITAPGPAAKDRVLLGLAEIEADRGQLVRAASYFERVNDGSTFGYDRMKERLATVPRAPAQGPAALVMPTVSSPPIHLRAEWGARPVRRAGHPVPMSRPYRITVHHAGDNRRPPLTFNDAVDRMTAYQRTHQDDNGWADIGYHFVIDGSGRIWQGRVLELQGAHAGNASLNEGNIGVCLMGNFEDDAPTPSQRESLELLVRHLIQRYGINVQAVNGHNEVRAAANHGGTSCPGRYLQDFLVQLKRRLG